MSLKQGRNAPPLFLVKKHVPMEVIAEELVIRLLVSGGIGIKNVPARTVPMPPTKPVIKRNVVPVLLIQILFVGPPALCVGELCRA